MNQPKVTVIIVAYNAEGIRNIFKKCLDSTLNLKYDNYEVIVVNNGSIDRTREILQNYEKDLKVINLKRNIGAAGARNIAYENSKSELVLLYDSDAIPEQDSLKELVKIAMKNNKIGALSGIQVDYKKRKITWLGSLIGIYGHDIFPNSIPSIDEIKESYYSFIPGFLLVKRKAIGNILHPKDFFIYYEDHELCFRIWSRGYYVKLYPIVVCSHEFKTSVKAALKKDPYLIKILNYCYVKNSTLLFSSIYRKYLPQIYLVRLLESFLYPPIIEMIHFPRYFLYKNNYNFIGAYYPSISLTYLKYSLKRLSIINEYGKYVPLLLKLNNSKSNILSPSKNIFGQIIIKLDYEKTIINDEDILKSSRKFIISR
jgi:GT2 family glycosyltransferase